MKRLTDSPRPTYGEETWGQYWDKLAAYEYSGLEPDDVMQYAWLGRTGAELLRVFDQLTIKRRHSVIDMAFKQEEEQKKAGEAPPTKGAVVYVPGQSGTGQSRITPAVQKNTVEVSKDLLEAWDNEQESISNIAEIAEWFAHSADINEVVTEPRVITAILDLISREAARVHKAFEELA